MAKKFVALQCTLWLVAVSVVPQLHQVLADHQHIYCAVHHEIEDGAPKSDIAEYVVHADSPDRGGVLRNSADGAESHQSCPFSSVAVQLSPSLLFGSSASCSVEAERELVVPYVAAIPTRNLLLIAPKQSPPVC